MSRACSQNFRWFADEIAAQNINYSFNLNSLEQPLNRNLFISNFSKNQTSQNLSGSQQSENYEISPLQVKLAKSISMLGAEEEIQPSPLTPFLFSKLQRFNSEVLPDSDLNLKKHQSQMLGDNKYINNDAMIIEEKVEIFKKASQKQKPHQFKKQKQDYSKILDKKLASTYEVIKFLGKGKIGKVYKVQSVIDGLFYAIKIIHLKMFDEKTQQLIKDNIQKMQEFNLYQNELQLIRLCDYQIQNEIIYIIVQDNKLTFIQMEHCEFSLLNLQQQHNRMYESEIRKLLMDVCSTLESMHSNFNQPHLNINPGNIVFSKSKRYKLADFGLSSIISNDFKWDQDKRYTALSNEQSDYKKDIYSLGIVLLEMMIDRQLSKGTRNIGFNVLQRLDNQPHYSMSLKQLIKRMVSSYPDQRPSLKEILKSTKVDSEEELRYLQMENSELEKQIEEFVKKVNRSKSV